MQQSEYIGENANIYARYEHPAGRMLCFKCFATALMTLPRPLTHAENQPLEPRHDAYRRMLCWYHRSTCLPSWVLGYDGRQPYWTAIDGITLRVELLCEKSRPHWANLRLLELCEGERAGGIRCLTLGSMATGIRFDKGGEA